MAKKLESETYGQMQSIISVVYLISGTMGAALSTTRLVREFDYNEVGIKADFNILSIGCIIALPARPVNKERVKRGHRRYFSFPLHFGPRML